MHRHPNGEAALRALLSAAELPPGVRIIDLGAGDGDAVRQLRALGYDAAGIDLAPGADVEYGDILSPPFAAGSFDAALSQCAFLLTGAPELAFQNTYKLLKAGGRLLFSDIVPGGEPALRAAARGFEFAYIRDTTDEWRRYYIEALWRGEAEPPPCGAARCRYLEAVLIKP